MARMARNIGIAVLLTFLCFVYGWTGFALVINTIYIVISPDAARHASDVILQYAHSSVLVPILFVGWLAFCYWHDPFDAYPQ